MPLVSQPLDGYDIVYAGMTGIRKSAISKSALKTIKSRCRRTQRVFKLPEGEEPPVVLAYREGEEFIWVPRYFGHGLKFKPERSLNLTSMGDEIEPIEFCYELRESRDQVNAAVVMEAHLRKKGGGILKAFTGFGKTFVSIYIAARFGCKIGVIVDQSIRISQWTKEILNFTSNLTEDDIGVVQGGRCDIGKKITLMTAQSLILPDKYPAELYEQFGAIVVDEAERFSGNVWSTVFHKFRARIRIGISATPERKDGLTDVFKWHLGRIGYEASEAGQSEKKTVNAVVIDLKVKDADRDIFDDFTRYNNFIFKSKPVNYSIAYWAMRALRDERKILMLSQRKKHPFILQDILRKCIAKDSRVHSGTEIQVIAAGASARDIEASYSARVTLSTYQSLRRGYSDSHVDTLFLLCNPGDVVQALGRLRDMKPPGSFRKSLQVFIFFLDHEEESDRWMRTIDQIERLGQPYREMTTPSIGSIRTLLKIVKQKPRFKGGARVTKRMVDG